MRFATIGITVLLATGATPAAAADVSGWDGDAHSAVRLIGGSLAREPAQPTLRAGLEINLGPGWKTYWRYPGDSGVPPRFDFSRSDNVADIKVLWPAPHRFTDDGGTSIGYKKRVIFPLHVTPSVAGKPVTLRMKLDYAVCEKLCVPAEAKAELTITGNSTANDAMLIAAETRVPRKATLGEADALAILKAKRVPDAAKPLVHVDVKAPSGSDVELFVEGPTADWALPVPQPAQGAPPGHRRFGFELDGLAPGADPKGHFALTFTAVAGEHAIEVTTHLD